jgi:hypothetical protein
MKKINYYLLTVFILTFVLSACTSRSPDLIVACGWDEVFIADISQEVPRKVWTWTGEDSEGLPGYMRNKFLTTDDCKPKDKGSKILITSSGGGVALVERETGNTLFYASVPNAHSAELLPNKLIVAAASFSSEGNRINLYKADSSDIVVDSDSLYGAHGLFWDKKSKLLWALGTTVLRSYSIESAKNAPSLKLHNEYVLPDPDGHDLIATDKDNVICISTASNVWLFSTEDHSFVLHPDIGNESKVKSVSYNSLNKEIAYVKASEDSWWAYYIRFTGSNHVVHLPGEKIYKARWLY